MNIQSDGVTYFFTATESDPNWFNLTIEVTLCPSWSGDGDAVIAEVYRHLDGSDDPLYTKVFHGQDTLTEAMARDYAKIVGEAYLHWKEMHK